MRKIWLIATTTYRRRIRSGTFLFLTFGLPVLMVIAGAIPFIRARGGDLPAVGYVDQTGRLAPVTQVPIEDATLTLTAYADTGAAQTAFQRGEIAGYLVIPDDYFQGQPAAFYAQEEPGGKLEEALTAFMRRAMLPDEPAWTLDRLADPSEVTYVARDSGEEEIAEGPAVVVRFATPLVLALVFALAVLTGASQMGSAIVREKDQRAMEMIITSLAPRELVAGKVLGMTLLSLTQVGVWAIGGGIAIGLALSSAVDVQTLSIPWEAPMWALLLGVPGYFLYAVLASGLGVIAGDSQQAQQLAGILGLLGLAPLWFMGLLINALNGPLAVALTMFPLTGPIIGLFRMALVEVPTWQLITSLAILMASLIGSIWLVARIFRAAMLMYGQALQPRQLLQALREA
jgi:ABC-2 type transport system permease protein